MSSLKSQPNTSRLIPEILARLASAHAVQQVSWFMPAGDKRSHGLLTTVVITSLISRKIQGTGVSEDFANSWLCRRQSRQITEGIFRVIACTDAELVAPCIKEAPFPSAETRELVPPDSSCLPLRKAGGLDSQPNSQEQLSPSKAPEMKGKPKNAFLFSQVSCEIADQPHPSLTQRPLLGCSQHASWLQLCQQHAHSTCF